MCEINYDFHDNDSLTLYIIENEVQTLSKCDESLSRFELDSQTKSIRRSIHDIISSLEDVFREIITHREYKTPILSK